jgi:uncharacterized protein YdeI (YjbR/CyaY-like superfamily)
MPTTARPKTFHATLERTGGKLNWTIIRIPFDVEKAWATRGQLRVRGEINGHEFRTSLFPDGKGGHYLVVNKQMQRGGSVRPGERARFVLAPDTAERTVSVPAELSRVLKQSKSLQRFYDGLSNSARSDIAHSIGNAKHAETRKRRAEQMAERLMETMEAERELPPLIQLALAQNASARAGWERMPPGHRRAHLLGIFYYRNPESRTRRIAKAMQDMMRYAESSGGSRAQGGRGRTNLQEVAGKR